MEQNCKGCTKLEEASHCLWPLTRSHENENVDSKTFFQLAESSQHTRGHGLKLYKRHCRLDSRKFFFSQRVVNSWNSLPQHIVEAPSVNSFKKRLDDYYNDMGLL